MLSRKRSRDRSPEKTNCQPAITANVIDVNCRSKTFVESPASYPLASNMITVDDITQREDHVIYSHEMIEEKSSFNSNGTGVAKLVLPHLVPAVVSAAKFAGRDRYIPLEKTESCDKAIISVFGVVISFQVSPKSCGGSHKLSRTYTLVDPSRPSLQFPIILHIFANTVDEFPQCVRTGDVMRCTDVKVDLYNGFPKLIGSDKNRSSFVVFSKKVNYLTGFSRLYTDSNANPDVEFDRGFPSTDWTIYSNPIRYKECASTTAKVFELSAWSEGVFLQSPLGEKSMCELNLGQVLRYTSQKSKDASLSQAVKDGRCDVTCMVAAIVQTTTASDLPKNARNAVQGPVTLLLWDGSTPGELTRHGAVGFRNYQEMSRSLRSAIMFPTLTKEKVWQSLSDLQEEIDQPYPLTESLRGIPLAVSCSPLDTLTGARLKVLRPGMWLRLRDLRIDKSAQDITYTSASTSSSSSSSSSSTSETSASGVDVLPGVADRYGDASGSTLTCMVGTVQANTHISLLLPYFRDVGLKGISYEEECARSRARTGPKPPCPDPHPPRALRPICNARGIPYVSLALCLSKKPPNRFLTRAHIVSYRPVDISRFVCRRPGPRGVDCPPSSVFRFSLSIADDSAVTDVLLFDKEAEYFLGTTPEEFESNQALRDRIEHRLIYLSELPLHGVKKDREPVIMDLMLTSYVSEVATKDGQRSAFQLAVSETCIIPSIDLSVDVGEGEGGVAFNAPCRRFPGALRHETVGGELIQSLFSFVNVASLSKNTKRPPQDKLDEKDIVETFCRGAGPGGQKINKSMNKVRLRHIPTGATVAVQEQRDLTTNRSLARKLLRDKVDLIVNGSSSKIARRISKIQKRKSKTAMRAKKKYDVDGSTALNSADGDGFVVVETADSYNSESDSDSDSDSDDSDSDDDK